MNSHFSNSTFGVNLKKRNLIIANVKNRLIKKVKPIITFNKIINIFLILKSPNYNLIARFPAVWKVISEKKLSTKDIDALFEVGKTGIFDGFTKKDKSEKFASRLVLEAPDCKVRFASETVSEYACPVCAKQMKSTSINVKCDSCGLTVWLNVSEKKLSENQVKQLLQNGKTGAIKGFIARSNGKPFDASLVVDKINKKVIFEYPKRCKFKLQMLSGGRLPLDAAPDNNHISIFLFPLLRGHPVTPRY